MAIFISQEYSIGFPETAFTLYAGYIHLLPRIIVWAAMKLGMTGVMPAMTWTVLFFNLLTVYLIYKSKEISSGLVKLAVIAYLVLMPFPEDIFNNVTDLQWNLIPLMAIIIIRRDTGIPTFIFDIGLLVLTGLTGINSIMFAVPCAYLYLRTRAREHLIKGSVVIICGLIQFCCLYSSPRIGRIIYEDGISDLIDLFVNRVVYRTLFDVVSTGYLNIAVFVIYLSILAFNLWYYRRQVTVHFILLFSAIFMSAVIYNLISAHRDTDFLITGMSRFWAERYFAFLRTCSFVLLVSSLNIVFSSALSRRNYRRCMAFSCFLLCLIMLHNFHARFQFEYNYYGEAAAFESALPGETVAFHYPHGWQTFLVKK